MIIFSHSQFIQVIIMCANPKTIREIMIAAEELNMIDSGEYVFFNIEIFGSLKKDLRPWFEVTDSEERNEQARKAYHALLTITTRKPEDEEYQKFSDEVSQSVENVPMNILVKIRLKKRTNLFASKVFQ